MWYTYVLVTGCDGGAAGVDKPKISSMPVDAGGAGV